MTTIASPAAPPPSHQLATTRLATGPRVHYVAQGDPAGEALLFLHGYGDSWFSFSRLLPLLSPHVRAYAFDQRGHGDSERPMAGYAIDDLAADAVAFLDAVGVARASLVAHSMGTFVARRVAETWPQRVSRLVLIGSAFAPLNQVLHELRDAVWQLPEPVPESFVREFQESTLHVPVPEPFFERVVAESRKLPARVWRAAIDGLCAFDDAADVGRIAAPTLILWGAHDAIFPRAEQTRLAASIPHARLTVYPDVGHDPHWERPERVAADLVAFLVPASPWPVAP